MTDEETTDGRGGGVRLLRLDDGAHRSLRDHVHRALRMAIISGRFAEGERLNERRLAVELGVSTTPLKEALRQLAAEGLVETLPRRGVTVRFGRAWAEEMIYARAALESVIAAFAARRITTDQIRELRAIVALMERATGKRDADELVLLNGSFHNAIHRASQCRHLTHLVERQAYYDDSARRVIHRDAEESRNALAEHRGICEAIADRDAVEAEARMRRHVLRSGDHYIDTVFKTGRNGSE